MECAFCRQSDVLECMNYSVMTKHGKIELSPIDKILQTKGKPYLCFRQIQVQSHTIENIGSFLQQQHAVVELKKLFQYYKYRVFVATLKPSRSTLSLNTYHYNKLKLHYNGIKRKLNISIQPSSSSLTPSLSSSIYSSPQSSILHSLKNETDFPQTDSKALKQLLSLIKNQTNKASFPFQEPFHFKAIAATQFNPVFKKKVVKVQPPFKRSHSQSKVQKQLNLKYFQKNKYLNTKIQTINKQDKQSIQKQIKKNVKKTKSISKQCCGGNKDYKLQNTNQIQNNFSMMRNILKMSKYRQKYPINGSSSSLPQNFSVYRIMSNNISPASSTIQLQGRFNNIKGIEKQKKLQKRVIKLQKNKQPIKKEKSSQKYSSTKHFKRLSQNQFLTKQQKKDYFMKEKQYFQNDDKKKQPKFFKKKHLSQNKKEINNIKNNQEFTQKINKFQVFKKKFNQIKKKIPSSIAESAPVSPKKMSQILLSSRQNLFSIRQKQLQAIRKRIFK